MRHYPRNRKLKKEKGRLEEGQINGGAPHSERKENALIVFGQGK